MWEALMVLRLIASVSPGFARGSQAPAHDPEKRNRFSERIMRQIKGLERPLRVQKDARRSGMREAPLTLPADALKGAIRLSFAAWRLSLPLSEPNNHESHDRKIA